MGIITHFTPRRHWEEALVADVYTADSLHSQGFIHCSTPEQVAAVANTIARERDDLVLLWIDEAKVLAKIVYENLEGGDKLFPHIYGPLNIDSIVQVTSFVKNKQGMYETPVM